MPKIDDRRGSSAKYCLRARWKLCAQESHWHAQNVSSEITTQQKTKRIILTEWRHRSTADSVRNTHCTKKQNNPVYL